MRTYFLITCCVFACLMPVKGQIVVDSIADRLPLANHQGVKALRTDLTVTLDEIRTKQKHAWKAYDTTDYLTPDTALWLAFELENRSEDTLRTYLYSVVYHATVYQQTGQGFHSTRNGYYVPLPQRANKSEYYFTELVVAPAQQVQLYVQLCAPKLSAPLALLSESGYWERSQRTQHDQANSIVFIYFFIFSLATLLIFATIFWFNVRGKLYAYYLGYLFFLLIYGFIVLRKTPAPVANFFQYAPKLSNDLFDPIQFMFIACYILFIRDLLRVKVYDKRLALVLRYLGLTCLVYAVGRFSSNQLFYDPGLAATLFNAVRLIILPVNFVLIFWIIFKVRHPLLSYFIVGQLLFFIGAALGTYINYAGMEDIPGHFFGFTESANIVFQMGLLGEVYCFSIALGKNVSLIQDEKERAGAALVKQLQENERLQTKMNHELDIKVREKTAELVQLYVEIEKEKEQKIKNEFNQKLRETEMMALRSQMNPHFIFNSMNAIKNLIMTERDDDAVIYLDDFSTLLRHILQNSRHREITVEEELETLELYLSLERSRLGAGFRFAINVSSREALSQYQIPPLLLQPIVENAIWHGLHPSLKAEKTLTVTFDTAENLNIIIEDNGIGRAASAKKKKLYAGMGTTIIRDRLALHNHLSDYDILLKIADLEQNGRVLGTRVTLTYNY